MSRRAPCREWRTAVGISMQHGFTLLEVLIAIALVAMIALLGYRALSALSESESKLADEATRWRLLDFFFARLEGDLRQAMPRTARLGATREPAWVGTAADAAGNSALTFSRAGPEFDIEPGSAGQRLAYRFRAGSVEVLYWPGYDRPSGVDPIAYSLLSDVAGFHLSYLASNGSWVDAWPIPGDAALPRAVRVQLSLISGETIERWLALR